MPISTRTRGYLPHWDSANAIYFVTFRLTDSLPRALIESIYHERRLLENAQLAGTAVLADRKLAANLSVLLRKAQRSLDSHLGACYLRDPRVAQTVADALRHFDGDRYTLYAWCVMPNHVHAILSLKGDFGLDSVLHAWKSYSAKGANRILGRTGAFWQREYFDHLIRSRVSLQKIIGYVRENPRKAGCVTGLGLRCFNFLRLGLRAKPRRRDAGATRRGTMQGLSSRRTD